ncbi:M56 family metallopeptidase [Flavobacterium sp. MC2016-06]|jgi:beta-lactamase regulating signal transducer with metallopeptidase domain|uniref:M56 family metallopeptidase n=1 Tax=Flavobacterium sp. MC2016-06 TaxID=2676308 RepID=UPI0012BB1380|nr:M56 family metallopeptidase [Flavobacterium sp. MC2016-06]MBU3857916.1 M56 family metallopeptidase [Flavobacterium sp. MC2016-06]
MITYLLKSGILLLVFYAVYKLWLENEKLFRFNRAYLLLSLVFSLIIPLRLISFQRAVSNKIALIQLDQLVIQKSNESLKTLIENLNLNNIILGIYSIAVLMLTIRFVLNLYSFYQKMKRNETQFVNGEKVVLMEEFALPHSFWNAIFINKVEFENRRIPSELIAHEKAHLRQKHTLDILFVEFLQIILWFNPIIIFYKKAIKLNHEFLADEAVNVEFNSVSNYQNLLLDIASNKTNIALASNINYLITKKRFLMMTKKQSPIKAVFKVFTVGVVCSLVLLIFSTESIAQTDKNKTKVPDGSTVGFDTENVKQPEFPGGMTEFYKFVGKNFKTPAEASKNKIEGKINMKFTIEKDGSVSEVVVINDLGYGLGTEAARVIRLSPKWIPASERGVPVRVQYDLPITIQAEK